MSNLVSNLRLGTAAIKRNKFNISSVTRTTCNFGLYEPTFYRHMIPNETVELQDTNIIQLADMPRQTMADLSMRTYHFFVPYRCVYRNFEAMMANLEVCTPTNTFVPTSVPWFTWIQVLREVMGFRTSQEVSNRYFVYDTPDHTNVVNAGVKAGTGTTDEGITLITRQTCDFEQTWDGKTVFVRFKARGRNLVKIIQGFGVPFCDTLSDHISFIPFAGMVYSYYKYLAPRRANNYNFENTKTHRIIEHYHRVDGGQLSNAHLNDLLTECLDCYFTFDMDFFTACVDPENDVDLGILKNMQFFDSAGFTSRAISDDDGLGAFQQNGNLENISSSAGISLAQKVLKFINRNTFVGRQLESYIKSRYGVSSPSYSYDSPYFIGGDITPISVERQIASATTEGSQLGKRGAYGEGGGSNKKFRFTSKEFGVWISLSTIIPHARYWQGVDKNATCVAMYEHFIPEFDGINYEPIRFSQLNANTDSDYRNSTFGLVPTYLHKKVGHDIMNGCFSLNSFRQAEFSSYDLDRTFDDMPSNDKWDFARCSEEVNPTYVGDVSVYHRSFLRIFTDRTPWTDHFYIRIMHDALSVAPMKTYSQCIDVQDNGGDFEINHV